MRELEEYRHNDLGSSFFILKSTIDQKIYLSHEHHVTKAFYYSLNDIVDLESSKHLSLHTGAETHSSISFWFLALESYINCLLKISCLKKKLDFTLYKKKDLQTRLNYLLDILELDRRVFNNNNVITKIHEFSQFRNELFHDRHIGNKIKFYKTNFSEIPLFSNQVDTFQSILILLEVAISLRFAIAGLDTMPTVIIRNADVTVWEKLDLCYSGILKPCFEAALQKHNLTTKLNLAIPQPNEFRSSVFSKGDISCLLTAEQDQKFFTEINQTETKFCITIYQEFLKGYNYNPGTLHIAKTMID